MDYMDNQIWFLIENEADFDRAAARYKEVKRAPNGTDEHKEKLLLAHLISVYEETNITLPDVDPIEMIKIRMEDLDLKASDLASLYGDKGTISKVLNYERALSITMIRQFSEFLRIPVECLIKEYKLKSGE
jgi:HTH-type transcriptional regulator/antitoxin HigA